MGEKEDGKGTNDIVEGEVGQSLLVAREKAWIGPIVIQSVLSYEKISKSTGKTRDEAQGDERTTKRKRRRKRHKTHERELRII